MMCLYIVSWLLVLYVVLYVVCFLFCVYNIMYFDLLVDVIEREEKNYIVHTYF
jgi:hypothetical protein